MRLDWVTNGGPRRTSRLFLVVAVTLTGALGALRQPARVVEAGGTCTGTHQDVSPALTDLGANHYVRMDASEPTPFEGGLYPGGANTMPSAHRAAGLALADEVVPLDANGNPNAAGKIAFISVGYSNARREFTAFQELVAADTSVNPQLVLINGAQAGQTAEFWTSPISPTWDYVDDQLSAAGLTPQQVQVAWVKGALLQNSVGPFPEDAQYLQTALTAIAQNLLIRYPNVKLAYFSSRIRSYRYWFGLSAEPAAFETGFGVKWLIEDQLEGDPDLNFDPGQGPVEAPWIAWGPYMWADGMNPRSDGLTWLPEDLVPDCTHPSQAGEAKAAQLMLEYFQTDDTARQWFLAGGTPLTPTPPTPSPTPSTTPPGPTPTPRHRLYMPMLTRSGVPNPFRGASPHDLFTRPDLRLSLSAGREIEAAPGSRMWTAWRR